MPKEVTNEDLAVMIKTGFDAVDLRFDKVDVRLDKVETHLSKVEDKVDRIVYKEIERLEIRVKKLEQK